MEYPIPTVVIVDDHPAIIAGFSRVWRKDLRVVGVARDASSAVAVAAQHRPSVVTMDLGLRGCPYDAIREIVVRVGSPVLVITGSNCAAVAQRCAEAGASGIISKGNSDGEMLAAVLAVARGEKYLGAEWSQLGPDACPNLEPGDGPLLEMVSWGWSTSEVAKWSNTSAADVEQRLDRLRERYEAKDDAHLIARAFKCGVLTPEQVG